MSERSERKRFTYLHLPSDFAPKYATIDECCSYARHGRWAGHQKIKAGRWRVFKDGRRTVVIFASVIEDEERLQAASMKRSPGRPKKLVEQSASAAGE